MTKASEVVKGAEDVGFLDVGFLLDAEKLKPVFSCQESKTNKQFICMLDSGASMPVWCTGSKMLVRTFPKAVLQTDMKSLLSGFGEGMEYADVYFVPKIELNNQRTSIVLYRVYLPVVDKNNFGTNLILPSSIFRDANIIISQMQPPFKRQLLFQCRNLWYIMKYTKCSLNAGLIKKLKERYGISDLSDKGNILGAEGEFKEELIQLSGSLITAENFPDEGQVVKGLENIGDEDVKDEDEVYAELMRKGDEIMKDL